MPMNKIRPQNQEASIHHAIHAQDSNVQRSIEKTNSDKREKMRAAANTAFEDASDAASYNLLKRRYRNAVKNETTVIFSKLPPEILSSIRQQCPDLRSRMNLDLVNFRFTNKSDRKKDISCLENMKQSYIKMVSTIRNGEIDKEGISSFFEEYGDMIGESKTKEVIRLVKKYHDLDMAVT